MRSISFSDYDSLLNTSIAIRKRNSAYICDFKFEKVDDSDTTLRANALGFYLTCHTRGLRYCFKVMQ